VTRLVAEVADTLSLGVLAVFAQVAGLVAVVAHGLLLGAVLGDVASCQGKVFFFSKRDGDE